MRDRDLVRLHWPAELRPAFDALFDIDDAMGTVVATASQPVLAAIKLAWWREALEKLDCEPPPAEPRLQAVARELLPRGLSGQSLAGLEEGWASLVQADQPQSFIVAADLRGPLLFRLGGQLLEPTRLHDFDHAGREFAAMDFARRGISDFAPQDFARRAQRYPRRLRPLTALWALARRDHMRGGPPFEPEATPGRARVLLKHRLFG